MSNFFNSLQNAVVEKDVEGLYREEIRKHLKTEILSPYDTDGYCEVDVVYNSERRRLLLLMEFKKDEAFTSKINISKVLIQILYYLKKFVNEGKKIPNVALIGDQNEAFVISTKILEKYLSLDIDWDIAPSNAYKSNRDLLLKLHDDPQINPFIFRIDKNFNFEDLIEKVKGLAIDSNYQIKITEENISIAYFSFILDVMEQYKKISPNHLVSIFIGTILGSDYVYIHPKKPSVLVWNDAETQKTYEFKINQEAFASFKSHYSRQYSPSEKRKFTEIADRLIEDTNRRLKGEYYTPSNFVKYSHSVLSNHLGDDWYRDFYVWDCAWGTGNLTRDVSFEKLFASTLNESDLNIGTNYNKSSDKFVYDFLNDDPDLLTMGAMFIEDSKMPNHLREAFQNSNSKILFYINPPYATGGNANAKERESKKDLGKTLVADLMREENLKVSEQLYAQFLYRILRFKEVFNLTNVHIGIFSPSLFLTGTKFKKFREVFLKHFKFVEGNIFKASNFADVKDTWAIDFSLWSPISEFESQSLQVPNEFKHNVLDVNEFGEVEVIGEKILWNLDNDETLQDWLTSKSQNNLVEDKDLPCFTSAFKYKELTKKVSNKALSFFVNDTNNIEAVAKGCYFMPSKITRNIKTITMTHENFIDCCVTFAARNIQTPTWINQKNEFSAPNEQHLDYLKFKALALVYSIFSNSNNNISYRNILVNGQKYNWVNEFFFLSREFIAELADKHYDDQTYEDTLQFSGERFAYLYLLRNEAYLSDAARDLLKFAEQLVVETYPFRKAMDAKYHLNTWDSSWYQIKTILRENGFDKELLSLENKIRTLKLELLDLSQNIGFLKFD